LKKKEREKEKKIDREAKCEGLRGEYKVFSSFLSLVSLCKVKLFKGNKREKVVVLDIYHLIQKQAFIAGLRWFFFVFFYIFVYKHRKEVWNAYQMMLHSPLCSCDCYLIKYFDVFYTSNLLFKFVFDIQYCFSFFYLT